MSDEQEAEAERLADTLKAKIYARTRLEPALLVCPREQSDYTPCVARDGKLAAVVDRHGAPLCVGCGANLEALLAREPS